MVKTIYFDDKSQSILKDIRDFDPDFNLSGFIQDCLSMYALSKTMTGIQLTILRNKLNFLQIKVQNESEEITVCKDMIKAAEKKAEEERIALQENERKKVDDKKRIIAGFKDTIQEFFIIEEKDAKVLAQDFYDVWNTSDKKPILTEFIAMKGYEEKPLEPLEATQ